jgi:hypothetical protein
MTLDDVDPNALGFLVHWLYTEKVAITEGATEKEWKLLSDLRILTQYCFIPCLQNDVMAKLYFHVESLSLSPLELV